MAEPADINVDELRRRARRRLVGAVVLALAVAVIVPMLLESQPKPLGDDVSVKIPPVDDGRFVNQLSAAGAADAAKSAGASGSPPSDAQGAQAGAADAAPAATATSAAPTPAAAPPAGDAATTPTATPAPAPAAATKPAKYDTHVPGASGSNAAASSATAKAPAPAPAEAKHAAAPAPATAPAAHAAVAASAATPGHAASAAHEAFAVQLAAFSDDKGANALAHRLKKAGYSAYTEPLKTSKGTLWRVRVGPYGSREAAVAARDRLKHEGHSGIVAPAG